jgi:hypothetical protein
MLILKPLRKNFLPKRDFACELLLFRNGSLFDAQNIQEHLV